MFTSKEEYAYDANLKQDAFGFPLLRLLTTI